MDNLEFTGERFIPGIDDQELITEHYQRYLSILPLVEGKRVLDIASGEGYGSYWISEKAKEVIGVDISEEAILHAQLKYQRSNLSFQKGSVAEIPLADNSVDVIVSFETIEHVDEKLQKLFLKEVKRVLHKDGIFILSTPNKEVYSDRRNYRNEFHMKEFYRDEFLSFLREEFAHIHLYNQGFQVLSLLTSSDEEEEQLSFLGNKKANYDGKYYIAIASNQEIAIPSVSTAFLGARNEVDRMIDRIVVLQQEQEERNLHIQKLDGEIAEKNSYIAALQLDNQTLEQHEQQLTRTIGLMYTQDQVDELKNQILQRFTLDQVAELRSQIARMYTQDQMDALKAQVAQMYTQEQMDALKAQVAQMYTQEQMDELKSQLDQMYTQEQMDELKSQVAQMYTQEQMDELRGQIDQMYTQDQVDDLKQVIRNKEGHIELLLESERAYERDKNTLSYRMMSIGRKIWDFFLPPLSIRRFFVEVLAKFIRHPKLMLHVINPTRIKNFFVVLKSHGKQGVFEWYNNALKIEQSNLNLTTDLQVNEDLTEKATQDECENNDLSIEQFDKLIFTKWKQPEVSIVIPVYNQFEYTYNCLKSIMMNSGNVKYEILIANDCSTDCTKDIEKVAQNVRLITTKKNVRFLLNCNNAAKYAKGKYILFLNNDTQVQENWLQPLVDLIERDDSVGMVGSKLIYPDGTLQEAGGIVWKDASAWNYGNRKNPEDPEYNYVKEADYISGAAIMIRKNLWEEIGGFDERFVPAYYEDTDLAFEVRKHGYKVMFQPLSKVVHFEGISNGTDVQTGLKHYQQVNFEKFYEKWKDVLSLQHEENAKNVFTAKDRSNHKKHILVVDHYVPHHDQDAGGKCTYMYLKTFVKMGFKVTFIGDNFYRHEPYTTELNQMGIEVLYGNYYYFNWQEWLKENSHYFDYIYLQRPHIAIKYIDLVKEYSNAKILYFAHDLHHIREYREYEMTGDIAKLESSKKWKEIEYELFDKADVGHVVGSFEQQKMQEVFPQKPIRNIPLYIYESLLSDINKDFSTRSDIVYVGGFGHSPNIDAVIWFAREIFPNILKKFPSIKWHVVGSKAPTEVLELASENIIIEGFLSDDDLDKLYRKCRIAVVPLRYGAGVKGKVVESAYYQIPLVTTSIGAEGLSREENFMVVKDDPRELAEEICSLYEDYSRLREMSDNGKKFINNYFTLSEAERVLRLDIDI